MKKNFQTPCYKIVYFSDNIIIRTSLCGCNVGGTDFGEGANDCTSDTPVCSCEINYNPAIANCIDPTES